MKEILTYWVSVAKSKLNRKRERGKERSRGDRDRNREKCWEIYSVEGIK